MTVKSSTISDLLEETTESTLTWINENMFDEDYKSLKPLLDHALTSVVPASDRALMVRLGCELMGTDWREALPGMAAFEFQNINLLVTDDYFDERESTRMGLSPIYKKWGSKSAIALGFIMKSMAIEAITNSWTTSSKWNVRDAVSAIEWASKWQYYSQFQEEELTQKPLSEVTIEDYFSLITNATAVGIAGAFELGCVFAGGEKVQLRQFREFGTMLGCLLQVRDDCIDYIYNEELIKKGAFSDFFARRRRLPILISYWEGSHGQRRKIEELFNKESLQYDDVIVALEIILSPKVKCKIRSQVQEIATKASDRLSGIEGVDRVRQHLFELIELFSDI